MPAKLTAGGSDRPRRPLDSSQLAKFLWIGRLDLQIMQERPGRPADEVSPIVKQEDSVLRAVWPRLDRLAVGYRAIISIASNLSTP